MRNKGLILIFSTITDCNLLACIVLSFSFATWRIEKAAKEYMLTIYRFWKDEKICEWDVMLEKQTYGFCCFGKENIDILLP